MTEDIRAIVVGVLVVGIPALLGWFARTYLLSRRLRRKQRFFGLPAHSECVLVVNRDPAGPDGSVARREVFALLELSALIKDCGAHADIVAHDETQQGFGERTEFCLGGPATNRRTAAHLQSLLPGVRFGARSASGPEQAAFTVGGERHPAEKGVAEHVLLARLTAGGEGTRPVFLLAGQSSVTHHAAARYLARHQARLTRRYGRKGTFCLLLKVLNSEAYGPDVVELVGDVTRAATTPPPGGTEEPDPDTDGAAKGGTKSAAKSVAKSGPKGAAGAQSSESSA